MQDVVTRWSLVYYRVNQEGRGGQEGDAGEGSQVCTDLAMT